MRVMTAVFDRYPEGGGAMLLALALADHADDNGEHIYPSVARLAAKTRQSPRTVQYQLRAMQHVQWLLLVGGAGGGRGRAAEYRINPEWLRGEKGAEIAPFSALATVPADAGKGAATVAPFKPPPPIPDTSKGCNLEHERVQSGAQKGATAIAPESSLTIKESSSPDSGPTLPGIDAPGSKPPPKKLGARVADPDDDRLARWMFGLILALHPKHRKPNLDKWADEIRLMRERDQRDRRAIASLFKWANDDPFWCSNILSPAKLREKWDQLVIRRDADAAGTGKPGASSGPKIDSQCAWHPDGAPRCERPGVSSRGSHPSSPWYCGEHMDVVEELASTRTHRHVEAHA